MNGDGDFTEICLCQLHNAGDEFRRQEKHVRESSRLCPSTQETAHSDFLLNLAVYSRFSAPISVHSCRTKGRPHMQASSWRRFLSHHNNYTSVWGLSLASPDEPTSSWNCGLDLCFISQQAQEEPLGNVDRHSFSQ